MFLRKYNSQKSKANHTAFLLLTLCTILMKIISHRLNSSININLKNYAYNKACETFGCKEK